MSIPLRLFVEVALLCIGAGILLFLRTSTASKATRLAGAVISSLALTWIGYCLTTQFGWLPVGRGAQTVQRSPLSFYQIQAVTTLMLFVIVAWIPRKPKKPHQPPATVFRKQE